MKNNNLAVRSNPRINSNGVIKKFFALWILFSVIVICFSNEIAEIAQPIINLTIRALEPNFSSKLSLVKTNQGFIFRNEISALQDIYRQGIPIAPKGSQFVASTSVFHSVAPLSLIIASAFMFRLSIFSIIYGAILALIFSLALILLTTPIILLGNIESQFYFAAINFSHRNLSSPLAMQWTVFIELGGQWLIAVIFALANIAIVQRLQKKGN